MATACGQSRAGLVLQREAREALGPLQRERRRGIKRFLDRRIDRVMPLPCVLGMTALLVRPDLADAPNEQVGRVAGLATEQTAHR